MYGQVESVKAVSADSVATDSVNRKATLGDYLKAGQKILDPEMGKGDSVIASVLPGKLKGNSAVTNVALPAAAIVGSAVGLPFLGALTIAKKASKLKASYNKYVPDEVKEDLSSRVKSTRQQVKEKMADVVQSLRKNVKILPAENMADWQIPAANYSGIVPLGNDDYAVVDDKSSTGGFYVFHIEMDRESGKITHVKRNAFKGGDEVSAEDCEDVMYLPQCQSVWIASEACQTISEYSMEGRKTGRQLAVPEQFSNSNIKGNCGFEALTYAADSNCFYTTTECALPMDGYHGADSLQPLRIVAFDSTMAAAGQWPYLMEKPELKVSNKYYVHGVPAMVALGSNQFFVMERELSIPANYVGAKTNIRIFHVDLDDVDAVADTQRSLSTLPKEKFLPKTEICSFSTAVNVGKMNFANFEGMCLGPQLGDGRQTLLLISDSQKGAGNKIYHLKDYLKVIILSE